MNFLSTRGSREKYSASAAIIKGLADDGGLFVPEHFPKFDISFNELKTISYPALAGKILSLFLDFTPEEIALCVNSAYSPLGGFEADPAPLTKRGGAYFLELFHGRTLAFKDMALSVLPYLTQISAKKHAAGKEIAVLTATSGDTGKAALAGFAGVNGVKIIVFYPKDGVSDVQRLQMTTQEGENAFVAAVDGNFDDAQRGVKAVFSDRELNRRLNERGIILTSANSINAGRLLPQIAYYYYAYAQMLRTGEISEGEKISFCVPTGNFGNILAAYYAKQMGLPVDTLYCASNSNKVLYDFFTENEYDANRELYLTASPSMDILVSSNVERFLFHSIGAYAAKAAMDSLAKTGKYGVKLNERELIPCFSDEAETFSAIKEMFDKSGFAMDTHTAVAYAGLKKVSHGEKNVIVSTASAYKFADHVVSAISGEKTRGADAINRLAELTEGKQPIPASLAGLDQKEILHKTVVGANGIKEYVESTLTFNE
ncbi:threonine synthase [Clostridia bacterium]|nr:threonine synthase [Clostridia bacterium]